MKNFLALAVLGSMAFFNVSHAQEKCASYLNMKRLAAMDPSIEIKFEQYKEQSRLRTEAYAKEVASSASKSTANPPTIPVVFHVMLTSPQLASIGGSQGVYDRIAAQIDVINRDFTASNSDSSQIPSAFKTLFGNPNIKFGIAHTKPDGSGTTGVEIKTITKVSYSPHADDSIKHEANGGYDPWDETRYINIWIVNISAGSSSQVLGYSYSPGYAQNMGQPSGVVLQYGSFGVKTGANSSQYWAQSVVKGRTLTHELGHYFDLWHVWGDDNGLCPSNGGHDDGITDTPPQADMNQSVCPAFPKYDGCSSAGNGVMFMNYMDYVTDNCMHMFSKGQATHILAQIASSGPSYKLTTQEILLNWPTQVSSIDKNNSFDVFPNPSTSSINISFANVSTSLKSISIVNLMGQVTKQIPVVNQSIYNVDLSNLSKGIYVVQCQFEEGIVTKKIVLQ